MCQIITTCLYFNRFGAQPLPIFMIHNQAIETPVGLSNNSQGAIMSCLGKSFHILKSPHQLKIPILQIYLQQLYAPRFHSLIVMLGFYYYYYLLFLSFKLVNNTFMVEM